MPLRVEVGDIPLVRQGQRPVTPRSDRPQPGSLSSALGNAPGGTWYDGKVFYYEGTTPHRPDMFMIVVEPSAVYWPER